MIRVVITDAAALRAAVLHSWLTKPVQVSGRDPNSRDTCRAAMYIELNICIFLCNLQPCRACNPAGLPAPQLLAV